MAAAPASSSNNTTPFFGCKISLISKSEIRYEGILYTINPKESTIALAKVRSFGSEDRPVERLVPPRDDIFEFIIFRASDIKDLIVDDPPPAPALTDPAIIQAHSTSTSFPTSFSQQTSISNAAPASLAAAAAATSQPTAIQQLQQASKGTTAASSAGGIIGSALKLNENQIDSSNKASKGGTLSNVSGGASSGSGAPPVYSKVVSGGGGGQSQQSKQLNQRQQNLQFNKPQRSGEQSQHVSAPHRSNQQQQQFSSNGFMKRSQQQHAPQNRVIGENQNPSFHARNGGTGGGFGPHSGFRQFNNSRQPFNNNSQRSGGGERSFGGYRRGGGNVNSGTFGSRNYIQRSSNHNHQSNGPKFAPIPDGDFDFEKAQADFKILEEKLKALKLNGAGTSSTAEGGDSVTDVLPGIPASAINVAALEEEDVSKEPCYNKTKSFFDCISCEALEREKGSVQRIDWKQERKLNRETFGVVSARRPTFFRTNRGGFDHHGGYHQHRGGFHQHRGSGTLNRNTTFGSGGSRGGPPRTPNSSGNLASSNNNSNNVSSTTAASNGSFVVANNARTPVKNNAVNNTTNGVVSSSSTPAAIAAKN